MSANFDLPDDIFFSEEKFESEAANFLEKHKPEQTAAITIIIKNLELIADVYGKSVAHDIMRILGAQISLHLEECGFFTSYKESSFTILRTFTDRLQLINWITHLDAHVKGQMRLAKYIADLDMRVGVYSPHNEADAVVSTMVERSGTAIKYSTDSQEHIVFYEEEMRMKLKKEYELIKSMDAAMKNDEFKIYLQPQHYLQDGDKVLSAEALARWIKKDGTVIYPGEFIPAFEKNGLISKLDRHIMELACRFIAEHIEEDWYGNLAISVNVSQVDLNSSDFIEYYKKVKEKYNIPDNMIEIEFTESAVFEDYKTFSKIMTELEKCGFTCSLDDFGAGSSSLNMLKEMPVNVLKMDRLFFVNQGVNDKKRNDAVIASVVAMARGLDMKIIAEGIESPEQISYLRKIGCDVIQGYVYSKPLPVDEFVEYVKNFRASSDESDEIETITEKPYEKLDRDALCRKYEDLLRYVNSVVMELDIENDYFTVVSHTENGVPMPFSKGKYSDFLNRYLPRFVFPEHLEVLKEKASLKSILLSFYRGDDIITCEFLSKFSEDEGDYQWISLDVHFDKSVKEKIPVATIFIHNIQERKQREMAVQLANMQLSSALHSINGIIYEYDDDKNTLTLLHNASGYPAHEFTSDDVKAELKRFFMRHAHPDDAEKLIPNIDFDFASGIRNNEVLKLSEFRRTYSDGKVAWKSISYTKAPHGNRFVFIIQDITEQKRKIERIKEQEQEIFSLVSSTFDVIVECNRVTKTLKTITGGDFLEKYGIRCNGTVEEFYRSVMDSNLIHYNDRSYVLEKLSPKALFDEMGHTSRLMINFRANHDGRTDWYELGIIRTRKSEASLCTLKLIDDMETRISPDQETDRLTGILSADAYRYAILENFTYNSIKADKYALIIIDIDNFSEINKKKGRIYGDVLLCRLASAIKKEATSAFTARIGGDEFAVLLKNADVRYAQRVAEKIKKRFTSDSSGEGETFSAGISELSPDGNIRNLHLQTLSCVISARVRGGNIIKTYNNESFDTTEDTMYTATGKVEIHNENIIAYDLFQRIYLVLSNSEVPFSPVTQSLGLVCAEYNITHAFAYKVDQSETNLTLFSEWGTSHACKKQELITFAAGDEETRLAIFNEKHIDMSVLIKKRPDVKGYFKNLGILASIIFPYFENGRLCAIIGFDESEEYRTWTEKEKMELSLISDLLGKFIYFNSPSLKSEVQSIVE